MTLGGLRGSVRVAVMFSQPVLPAREAAVACGREGARGARGAARARSTRLLHYLIHQNIIDTKHESATPLDDAGFADANPSLSRPVSTTFACEALETGHPTPRVPRYDQTSTRTHGRDPPPRRRRPCLRMFPSCPPRCRRSLRLTLQCSHDNRCFLGLARGFRSGGFKLLEHRARGGAHRCRRRVIPRLSGDLLRVILRELRSSGAVSCDDGVQNRCWAARVGQSSRRPQSHRPRERSTLSRAATRRFRRAARRDSRVRSRGERRRRS